MSYSTLLRYSGTNVHLRQLLQNILASKFAEYVRSNMQYVSAGDCHTSFVTIQGQLYVMGRNEDGQLGLGHKNDVNELRFYYYILYTLVKYKHIMRLAFGCERAVSNWA